MRFSNRKYKEINSMSEVDLKALLKPYRTPTTFKNRVKKRLQRTFWQRTSNNSKNKLRALAHRLYIPGLVNKYRRDIERPERAAAIARLNADEMREYQKELPGPKTAFSGDMGINFDAWRNATPEERSQGWAWKYPAAAAAGGRRFTVRR
jgi:hypothetical protein